MTIPLPNPLNTTETVLIGLILVFFLVWGWRHGLDAVVIWGLVVIFAAWAAPILAGPLGKITNAFIGAVRLLMAGQFSVENWSAVINAQSQVVVAPVNVQDPNSTSMQLMTLIIFVMITFIGFRTAKNRAGKKDPFIASVFGALGAIVVGYIIIRFIFDRLFTYPQTVEIAQTSVPPININATLLIAVVLVLVVYGIQRSKPPANKG